VHTSVSFLPLLVVRFAIKLTIAYSHMEFGRSLRQIYAFSFCLTFALLLSWHLLGHIALYGRRASLNVRRFKRVQREIAEKVLPRDRVALVEHVEDEVKERRERIKKLRWRFRAIHDHHLASKKENLSTTIFLAERPSEGVGVRAQFDRNAAINALKSKTKKSATKTSWEAGQCQILCTEVGRLGNRIFCYVKLMIATAKHNMTGCVSDVSIKVSHLQTNSLSISQKVGNSL